MTEALYEHWLGTHTHHHHGAYPCHTCGARDAWLWGSGWACHTCGEQGHIILARTRGGRNDERREENRLALLSKQETLA